MSGLVIKIKQVLVTAHVNNNILALSIVLIWSFFISSLIFLTPIFSEIIALS